MLLQWKGKDWLESQNSLRRLLVAHYLPRINGQVMTPTVAHTPVYLPIFDSIALKTGQNPLAVLPTIKQVDLGGKGGRGFGDITSALNYVTQKNQLELLRDLPDAGIETYWVDAGWFAGLWPRGRGSWVPKKEFPNGLRPLGDAALGDAAHRRGMKFLLWFDPEGVAPGSIVAKEHPEWVLHHLKEGPWGGIYKWSDPQALQWMISLMSHRIREWGIDCFRTDRNTCSYTFWKSADSPDREGITEIRQIEGFHAFWDGLLRNFPNLTIDNANWRVTGPDLEAMKRTIGSLTRSEVTNGGVPFPSVDQAHTAELNLWVPLHANILHGIDPYNVRSTATTGTGIGLNLVSPYVFKEDLRKAVAEIKELRPYWLGDFYPLTEINVKDTAWCGWQFSRRDLGAGFAMFFRRPKTAESSILANLHGLDASANYEVSFAETYDIKERQTMPGAALKKLRVSVGSAPGSMLVRYRRLDKGARQ